MDLIRAKLQARGHHRLHFGGDSESSADTHQTDKRAAAGDFGVATTGDGNTVTTTDHGAVIAGRDVARFSVDAVTANTKAGIAAVQAVTGAALTTTRDVYASSVASNEKAAALVASGYAKAFSDTKAAYTSSLGVLDEAYKTAKAGDQRVVSMVGLAVIGLAAVAFIAPALLGKK